MNFAKYLKTAFLYHWNLLAFAGGMGFAALSGLPDVLVVEPLLEPLAGSAHRGSRRPRRAWRPRCR